MLSTGTGRVAAAPATPPPGPGPMAGVRTPDRSGMDGRTSARVIVEATDARLAPSAAASTAVRTNRRRGAGVNDLGCIFLKQQ